MKKIFIGGCGSSGTTLLAAIFDAHPEIAVWHESSIFDRPEVYRTSIDKLQQDFISQSFDDYENEVLFPIRQGDWSYFGLRHGRYEKDITHGELIKMLQDAESVHKFLSFLMDLLISKRKKSIFCDKTPNNILNAQQILDEFDGAHFIHVIRDGRDVVQSLVNRRGFNLHSAIVRWLLAMGIHDEMAGSDMYIVINYEDLVKETPECLKILCQKIGIDFEKDMFNFKRDDLDFGYANKPISAKSIGKWKGMDETQKRIMQLTMGQKLFEQGYE